MHGAVILGSVGLVVFGLAELRGAAGEVRRRRALAEDFRVPRVLVGAPLGRYPMALALAFGTVVVGSLLILRIQADAIRGFENQTEAVHGFEDPWVQPLLAFNVAFLALLFLAQAWQASRSSGEEEGDGPMSAVWGRLTDGLARGGGRRSSCRCHRLALHRRRDGLASPRVVATFRELEDDRRRGLVDGTSCMAPRREHREYRELGADLYHE